MWEGDFSGNCQYVNVSGGYREYLKLSLFRYMEKESEEKRRKKTAQIERSIIKKFRRSLWSPFTKALNKYQLIQGISLR